MTKNQNNGNDFSISVVIPAYNAEKTIVTALDSVKNQTKIPNFYEVIVVDDGSTDRTFDIVNEYFRNNGSLNGYVIRQKNAGVSVARNTGIYAAKGSWISLLDSDDVFHPKKNEIVLDFISNNPDADFIGGNYTEAKTRIPFLGELPYVKKINPVELLIKWVPSTPTVMMRKSVFEEVGGYDEKMRYAEDGDLYLRIAEKYNYYVLQENLANVGPDTQKFIFGDSGLSGNLSGMFFGNIQILNHALKRKSINTVQYTIFVLWNVVKHVRRVVITKIRKVNQ
ncbi:glycosyltransferase family 2 protein [Leuconostoc lactis]|uniref:glycosyltransferase family 2 protein n=1 Tax=Leuconostoc lactis TaxID=1246 RepID=UPI0006DCE7E4|nr:glycosyltransferase [Leuconostoc lactis]KQB82658.1 hypothetical protein AN225_02250 [Leuconostoc lactis]